MRREKGMDLDPEVKVRDLLFYVGGLFFLFLEQCWVSFNAGRD